MPRWCNFLITPRAFPAFKQPHPIRKWPIAGQYSAEPSDPDHMVFLFTLWWWESELANRDYEILEKTLCRRMSSAGKGTQPVLKFILSVNRVLGARDIFIKFVKSSSERLWQHRILLFLHCSEKYFEKMNFVGGVLRWFLLLLACHLHEAAFCPFATLMLKFHPRAHVCHPQFAWFQMFSAWTSIIEPMIKLPVSHPYLNNPAAPTASNRPRHRFFQNIILRFIL